MDGAAATENINPERPEGDSLAATQITTVKAGRRPRLHGAELGRALWYTNYICCYGGIFFAVINGGCVPIICDLLHVTDRAFGIIMSFPLAAAILQVPASIVINRYGHRRTILFVTALFHRALWIPVALTPLLLGPGPAGVLVFAALMAIIYSNGTFGGLAWQAWMADLVPARRRGAFFGLRSRLWNLSSLVGSVSVAAVLWFVPHGEPNHTHMKWTLLAIFVVASGFGLREVFGFLAVPDVGDIRGIRGIRGRRGTNQHWLDNLIEPLRNPKFVPFLCLGVITTAIASIQTQFMWRHCLSPDALHLGAFKAMSILQIAPLVAAVAVGPWWGFCLDRFGRKATLLVALVGAAVMNLGWFAISLQWWWVGLIVVAAIQVFWSGVDMATFNLLLGYTVGGRGQGGASYVAAYNVTLSLAAILAGYAGGEIAQQLDGAQWVHTVAHQLEPWHIQFTPYLVLLLVGLVIRVAAIAIFLPRIPRGTRENTANNVRAIANDAYSRITQFFGLA